MPAHVVVPYPSTNSSVRTRALRWIERSRLRLGTDVLVHGPGFGAEAAAFGEPVLLLRNIRALSRGRAEARLLATGSPGVYDLDDGLPWDDGTLPGHQRPGGRIFPKSLIARRAAAAADRVIAGNELLADWASGLCNDVVVVPTCVEPADYRTRADWSLADRPVLGWIGSPATERYLVDIAPSLAEVHRRTGARVAMISGPGAVPEPIAAFTDKTTWFPESDRCIADWDVGLMPLRDGVYERAKCGYKLLQYAASAIPAVGSPVGVNRGLLNAMDGLAPETPAEWVDALVALLDEPAERRRARGRAGRRVADHYSYAHWHDTFLGAVGWSRA